MSIAVGIG